MRYILLIGVFVLACSATQKKAGATSAMWEYAECQWYFSGDRDVPPDIRRIHLLRSDGSAKVCYFYRNKVNAYFVATAPKKGVAGVCHYVLAEVYRDPGNNKWGYLPPKGWPFQPIFEIFMTSVEGECPRVDHPSYLSSDGVSEGTFLNFSRFWHSISTSPVAFEAAAEPAARSSSDFQEFHKMIADKVVGSDRPWTLRSLSLADHTVDLGGIYFDACLTNLKEPGHAWCITVDISPADFRILRVTRGVE